MICTLALHIKNDSKHTWIAKSKQIEYFAAFLLAELYFPLFLLFRWIFPSHAVATLNSKPAN